MLPKSKAAKSQNKEAQRAAIEEYGQIGVRQQQEQESAVDQLLEENRSTAEAAAVASVSAGEAGVSGNSVDAVIADIEREGARNRDNINRNKEMSVDQLQEEKRGSQAQARRNSVRGPSLAALGVQIAGVGVSSYNAKRAMAPEGKAAPSSLSEEQLQKARAKGTAEATAKFGPRKK